MPSSRRVQILVGGALVVSFAGMVCTWALHTPFALSCTCLLFMNCEVGFSSFPCQQTVRGTNILTSWCVMPRDLRDTFGCLYRTLLCFSKTVLIPLYCRFWSVLLPAHKRQHRIDCVIRISPLVYDTIMCSLAVYRGVTMYREDLSRGKKLITVIIR